MTSVEISMIYSEMKIIIKLHITINYTMYKNPLIKRLFYHGWNDK